jgi:DNA-binding winged helix-turn-helix (wHTH) protein
LAVLLQNPKRLTAHYEIIEQVWRDNPSGVTPVHVAQYIKKLRKVFAEHEPGKEFIETAKGRGYSFVGDVMPEAVETEVELTESNFLPSKQPLFREDAASEPDKLKYPRKTFFKPAYFSVVLIPLVLVSVLAWMWFPQNHESEIRRVVEESQKFESLVLYNNPAGVEEAQFGKYWVAETDLNSDVDVRKVRAGVQRLIREGKYYGKESKCEQFDFQSVDINEAKDFAVVKTLEKWFLAEYLADGTILKNKTVGPYAVTYTLRRTDGRWLIEKSSTARAKPAPLP